MEWWRQNGTALIIAAAFWLFGCIWVGSRVDRATGIIQRREAEIGELQATVASLRGEIRRLEDDIQMAEAMAAAAYKGKTDKEID